MTNEDRFLDWAQLFFTNSNYPEKAPTDLERLAALLRNAHHLGVLEGRAVDQGLVKETANKHMAARAVLSSAIEYLLRLKDAAVFNEADHERQELIGNIKKLMKT